MMLAVGTVLRILELQSELALELVKKLTPEQVQGFVERHEQRIDWLRGLIDRDGHQEESPGERPEHAS